MQIQVKPENFVEELKRVCMNAAQYTPVGPERKPWGCIMERSDHSPSYCDGCPCIKICPYEHKCFYKKL